MLLCIVLAILTVDAATIPLVMLKSYESAKCLDGSLGGYYMVRNVSSTKFIIELEGGGECASLSQCSAKLHTNLGSSTKFAKTLSSLNFLNDLNESRNPYFSKYNHIFIPYCSQDLWTGTRWRETDPFYQTFYFGGHEIFKSVIQDVEMELNHATEIILTGESAGGIGVWNNVDFLAAQFPKAKVYAVPIAGFYFFASPYTGPHHTSSVLVDFRENAWPSHYELWGSYVDQKCKDNLKEPSHCVLSNYSFPYIETPAFIVEAQSDRVVLTDHDWVPSNEDLWTDDTREYLNTWRQNMTNAIFNFALTLRPDDGIFFPSCFIHTDFNSTSPLINNTSYIEAVAKWIHGNGKQKHVWKDDCGLLCNPTCSH